ncbi:MAG: hypothetical protein ABT940_11050 [Alphaproteobacteria bacterium]
MRTLIAATAAVALLAGCESMEDVGPVEALGGVTLAVVGGVVGAQFGSGAGQAASIALGTVVGGVVGVLGGMEIDAALEDEGPEEEEPDDKPQSPQK